uniref:Ig-like domain-containing protein n=1 Tax=Lates calcarifer TaxID=8187 RepID=A0A4W6BP87_LATCA
EITLHRGSSVKLSCEAIYNLKRCGLVHVEWCNFTKKCAKLTDPSRYFTTVNETAVDENTRRRQVVTEILSVTTEDDGQFQCNAHCEGESALGHYIIVKVKDGSVHKGFKRSNKLRASSFTDVSFKAFFLLCILMFHHRL